MTEDGNKIVENLLREWAQRCAAAKEDGEDIIMDEDSNTEKDLAILKECVEKYQASIDANPWVQSLIATL